MNALTYQWERQQEEKARLSSAWMDHGPVLVLARDGYMFREDGEPGRVSGSPEKASARWRRVCARL